MTLPRDEYERTAASPASASVCPVVPGDVMAGRYNVELLLGEGTFGWVVSAIDSGVTPPRRVAIKILRPEHARVPGTLRRFRDRELALLRRVDRAHNVVRVLEPTLCVHQDLPFIVLEFIDGPSLRERIDSRRPFTSMEAVHIGLGIARGLAALHEAGIVHRDLKPTNVRLRAGADPVIVDLGIATTLEATEGLTATGRIPMTLRYAAPEQLAGRAADAPSDVYALGVILEEMRVHGQLAALARRCLDREPSRRPTAGDVATRLEALLRGRAGSRGRALALSLVAIFFAGIIVSPAPLERRPSLTDALRWNAAASLRTGRYGHTATRMVSGQVLVVGGYDRNGGKFVGDAELYDPALDRWIPAGRQGPRTQHATVLLPSGDVLIVGGIGPDGPWTDVERYTPSSGTWTKSAPMASERFRFTATWLPGIDRVLVEGGRGAHDTHASSELYDPQSNRWTTGPPMSTARAGHAAIWIQSVGRVLVVGGDDDQGASLASAEMYDPAPGRWIAVAPLSTARVGFTATLLGDGRVLVVGGTDHGVRLSSAEIYDATANRWENAMPMHRARYQHTATLLADGRVLVVGGVSSDDSSSAEVYDPRQDAWTVAAAPNSRHGVTATLTLLADDTVLLVGGSGANPQACDRLALGSIPLALSGIPRPVGPVWTLAAPMRIGRHRHVMTSLQDGRVLVVGAPAETTVNVAEVYDPRLNTWAAPVPMTAMPPGRSEATATLLQGTGEVLVAGGFHREGAHYSTERFDPVKNAFSPAGPLNDYRGGHTATALPDGDVLVTGGHGGGVHASADRYDHTIDQWGAVAPMSVQRKEHMAALLPDGRVLVAGGINGRDDLMRSSELYSAATNVWSPAAPLNWPRWGGTMMPLDDGRIVLAGGYGEATGEVGVEIYDPSDGQWQAAPPMRVPRAGCSVALLRGNRLLVLGGRQNASTDLDSVEIYDVAHRTWSDGGSLHTARKDAAALTLADGRVLVSGGLHEDTALSSTEICAPE